MADAADAGARAEIDQLNREMSRNLLLETALIAFGLGAVAVISVVLVLYAYTVGDDALFALGLYVLVVHVGFHVSEFLTAALLRPHDTHPDAFMLFHSTAYMAASGAAFTEFFLEAYVVPQGWKLSATRHPLLAIVFCLNQSAALLFTVLVVVFYGIRVVAMLQCGANFSLLIEHECRGSHRLVQNGLYAYLRHPSYFGWFWRTALAQFILANPVSAVAHTVVTWYFFRRRIAYEEATLERPDYFGEEYKAYKRRTRVGIPFCSS